MTDRRSEEPAGDGKAVPRDMPDQQAGGTPGRRDRWSAKGADDAQDSGGAEDGAGDDEDADGAGGDRTGGASAGEPPHDEPPD
ncbi:hypothetical protein ABZ951_31160 [Streptomyces sp. NPDC046215]